MKTRAALVISVLGAATSAFGQGSPDTQGRITYTIGVPTFWNVTMSGTTITAASQIAGATAITGANQGVLFKVIMTLGLDSNGQGGQGAHITWSNANPNIPAGTSGGGTCNAMIAGFFDLLGDGGAAGTAAGTWSANSTSNASVRRRTLSPFNFAESGSSGTVANSGAKMAGPNPNQNILGVDGSALNPANGVAVWQGLWIPTDLSARTVSWTVTNRSSNPVLSTVNAVDDDPNAPTAAIQLKVQTAYTAAATPVVIVPGPGSLALLGLGGLVALRRRRA